MINKGNIIFNKWRKKMILQNLDNALKYFKKLNFDNMNIRSLLDYYGRLKVLKYKASILNENKIM